MKEIYEIITITSLPKHTDFDSELYTDIENALRAYKNAKCNALRNFEEKTGRSGTFSEEYNKYGPYVHCSSSVLSSRFYINVQLRKVLLDDSDAIIIGNQVVVNDDGGLKAGCRGVVSDIKYGVDKDTENLDTDIYVRFEDGDEAIYAPSMLDKEDK